MLQVFEHKTTGPVLGTRKCQVKSWIQPGKNLVRIVVILPVTGPRP